MGSLANIIIVAYLLIVLAMIAVILMQRSEGGGLGMGSSGNGLVSVRGTANLLTRTTAILAALFMGLAIMLTILAELDRSNQSILDRATQGGQPATTVLDAIQQLQQQQSGDLPVPQTPVESAPAPTDAAPAADPGLPTPEAAPAIEAPEAPAPEQPAAPVN